MSATRFYISCKPARVTHTGYIMPSQVIGVSPFEDLSYTGVFNNDPIEFAYIESDNGDQLSNFFSSMDKMFSIQRLTESEFVGAIRLYYPTDEEIAAMTTPLKPALFTEFISNLGLTTDDVLADAKEYKKHLFKEIIKKKFYDDNDSIADVAKGVMLFSLYSDSDLTIDQLATKNDLITRAKAIYTVDICLSGLDSLIGYMESVLPDYYAAKTTLEASTDLSTIKSVDYK